MPSTSNPSNCTAFAAAFPWRQPLCTTSPFAPVIPPPFQSPHLPQQRTSCLYSIRAPHSKSPSSLSSFSSTSCAAVPSPSSAPGASRSPATTDAPLVSNLSSSTSSTITTPTTPPAASTVPLETPAPAPDHTAWAPSTHPFQLYNTLSRSKQTFTTIEPGVVRFYSCGPTVYDYAHIGNFRAFLTYDVAKRWLLYRGYNVRHVMNLTDVDDKIIARVAAQGGTAKQLTDKFARLFFADLALLNVIPADVYPRATGHIHEIEEIVMGLKRRGFAYEMSGSTYFAVSKFCNYGRLAQLDRRSPSSHSSSSGDDAAIATGNSSISSTQPTSTDRDEYDKDDVRDFALWKAYKQEDGDVYWSNSLGKGRPGWHIECSCMAMKYLGPELDLHGGGIDLVFPHHENEIAQSEALTDRPFARFWIHNGFVNIDNEKMSKSLGNFRTLRDIVKKSDDARAFRYLVVSSQYRSALAFTDKSLKSAKSTVKRLDTLRAKLEKLIHGEGEDRTAEKNVATNVSATIERAKVDFCNAMDDDLNTPRATAAMFSLVNATEKMLKAKELDSVMGQKIMDCFQDMDRVLGIFYTPDLGQNDKGCAEEGQVVVPPELAKLLEERVAAKKAKNFARADEIRDEVTAVGFRIIDTPTGPKLKPLEDS